MHDVEDDIDAGEMMGNQTSVIIIHICVRTTQSDDQVLSSGMAPQQVPM